MSSEEEIAVDGFDPSLFADLADDQNFDESAMLELVDKVEQEINQERGFLAWCRALSTEARLGVAIASTLLTVAVLGAPSPKFFSASWIRVVFNLGSLGILTGSSIWFGLRPLHRPGVPRGFDSLVVVLSLLALVILAILPITAPMPDAPDDWAHAMGCLYIGTILALPSYIILRLLDRGGRPISAFLAASAAALAANAALAMRCDNTSFGHMLKGHVSIGLLYVTLVAVWYYGVKRLLRT